MPINNRLLSTFLQIFFALLMMIVVGAVAFHLLEGYSAIDSVYMAVITLSTVGYGEPAPMSQAGRLFSIVYIIGGVTMATYFLGSLSRLLIEGQIQWAMGRRRTMSKINRMKDHYIICGYGRIGSLVAGEFAAKPIPFVIIERDEDIVKRIPDDIPVIYGDATEEEILKDAGIERAKGLVTVLRTDADNLFVTLSARELNPSLFIISRYEEERSESKLRRAGADKVVSPYIIGGTRMASAALRPAVIDFIELATQSENLGLQIEEAVVPPGSPIAGVSVVDSNIRSRLDIIIVAVKKKSGHMNFNPGASTIIEEGDRLIAIGERAHLNELDVLLGAEPEKDG
ncbi:MAG: potassium channel protein [Deltaproteobacteria bacterium]|nr:MAG: potassium channel protein [Deltaproteobacteria bacterium]